MSSLRHHRDRQEGPPIEVDGNYFSPERNFCKKWKEDKKFVVLEVSGEQKKAYDEVIFSKSDFVRIPLEAQQIMAGFEKITFSNANMKHGALSWGTDPLDDNRAQILQRFAGVFEQTYTRFLDLQKKEEQAVKLAEESLLQPINVSLCCALFSI